MNPTLLAKIQTMPHPWYGTANPLTYNRRKNAASEMLTLTDAQKAALWPGQAWPMNRLLKMPRSQLQQALNGNFMLAGEHELRVQLQLDAHLTYLRTLTPLL